MKYFSNYLLLFQKLYIYLQKNYKLLLIISIYYFTRSQTVIARIIQFDDLTNEPNVYEIITRIVKLRSSGE